MVTIDVRHDGLGRFARLSAPSRSLAERRASSLSRLWEDQFARRQSCGGNVDEFKALQAREASEEAERAVHALTSILIEALRASPEEDWTPLYDTSVFAEPAPVEPAPPQHEPEPQPDAFPRDPLTLAVLLNPRAMRRRREAAVNRFNTAHDAWSYLKRWREGEHGKAIEAFRASYGEWEARQAAFLEKQKRANARLDELVASYAQGAPEAVIGRSDLALLSLDRPAGFPCFWSMRFDGGSLQIDYDLPTLDDIPLIKAVKYIPSRQVFDTTALSEPERERLYGEAVFQTCLAVVHRLFSSDSADAVKSVTFNGWASYIDGTGVRPGRACILSLTADKRFFMSLDLASVDPQACFRALNGTMSSKLAALTTRPVS